MRHISMINKLYLLAFLALFVSACATTQGEEITEGPSVDITTEGEGDGSLAYWRKVHWEFFTRELSPFGRTPEKSMPVVCERFNVVYS